MSRKEQEPPLEPPAEAAFWLLADLRFIKVSNERSQQRLGTDSRLRREAPEPIAATRHQPLPW